jgi:phosphatidylglycerol:prolipoprotein diacylglycerol transferase
MYPIFLRFDSFEIRWYGIMIALAFLAGTWIGLKEAKRKGYDSDLIYDLLFYVMVAGIVGARLYYVAASNLSYFIEHPLDIVAIWRGGLSLHGGLIGGLLAGVWFCRKRGLAFWDFADLLTPSIILGQAVGRGACTLNGCSFGKPTGLPWAIVFTNPDAQAPHNIPLHPTQFYEMGTDFLIFFILWNLRTRMRFPGQLFLVWAMTYAVARFVLEFFRGDSLLVADLVPVPQAFSLFLLALAGILYLWRQSQSKPSIKRAA